MAKSYRASSAKNRYLTFELSNEQYGVEILRIKEIVGYQPPTHIPRTPKYVLGVLNLRGAIIPVIDLRAKLDIQTLTINEQSAVIITTLHDLSIGFVVDRVHDVANIAQEDIEETLQFGSEIDATFLKGVAKNEKRVVMILDLEKIFNTNETKNLEALTSNQQKDK